MTRIIKFNPAHLWLGQIQGDPVYVQALVDNHNNRGLFSVWSVFLKNRLLAVCGVKFIHPGVGELFMYPCEGFEKHRIALVKAILKLLQSAEKDFGLTRMQAPFRLSLRKEIRFLEFFGFTKEGILKGYDPDTHEDCVMLGRVKCPS